MYLYSKNIYFPDQIKREGYLEIEKGIIVDFKKEINTLEYMNHRDDLIIPGFIDQHIHGWATGSFNLIDPIMGLKKMQETLPYAGVTSFLASTGAWPLEDLKNTIKQTSKYMEKQEKNQTEVIWIHLEGPFISPKQAGMMNKEGFQDASIEIMQSLLDAQSHKHAIKLMTMAPEIDNAKELIKYSNENGIQLSVGHSDSSFDTIADLTLIVIRCAAEQDADIGYDALSVPKRLNHTTFDSRVSITMLIK